MKTHTFALADPISILGFSTALNLACNANSIHEGAALKATPSFVADRVASTLNSSKMQNHEVKGLDTTVNSNGPALQAPRLRSYSKVMNRLMKRYGNEEASVEANAAILIQPAGMILLQYGEVFLEKPFALETFMTKAP